jgi:hypothetical protein
MGVQCGGAVFVRSVDIRVSSIINIDIDVMMWLVIDLTYNNACYMYLFVHLLLLMLVSGGI